MTTVIIGPGYAGNRVLERLPADSVIALGRSRSGSERLDLDNDEPLPIALPDKYSVIYTVPPYVDRDSESAPTDRRLAALLARLTRVPERFVYLSTTGVYGNRDGATVDESALPRPQTSRAKRRLAAEMLVEEWCARRGTVAVILRVPGIYGPGRLGLDRLRAGTPVLDEADANPGNRIHVDDLVSCCIAALSPQGPGGVYNVGDGDTRSSTWFASELARQTGLPPPPTVSRKQAENTFSPVRLSFLRESRVVDVTKMRKVLGVIPKYADGADGIAASLGK